MTRRTPTLVTQQYREQDDLVAAVNSSPARYKLLNQESRSKRLLVKAGHGLSFFVSHGQKFRIIDLHGSQIVDFLAWRACTRVHPFPVGHVASTYDDNLLPPLTYVCVDPKLHFSAAHTRWHLRGSTPAVGDHLLDTAGKPMFKIVDDTVKVHDMTFPCCYPELYDELGLKDHRSCSQNIVDGLRNSGFNHANGDSDSGGGEKRWIESHLQVPPPFNVFQNTPFYALKGGLLSSRAGDYIEMEALGSDVVCAVSSCPWDVGDFAPPTDVMIEIRV